MNESTKIGNLMVIDDSEEDHFLYERIIRRSNLVEEILFFSWAHEALEYLRQPDSLDVRVIFLDINMPRMNGFEFLETATKEFGSDNLNAVIIMLTTSISESDKFRAESFDVVKGYLNKPLSISQLQQVSKIVSSDL